MDYEVFIGGEHIGSGRTNKHKPRDIFIEYYYQLPFVLKAGFHEMEKKQEGYFEMRIYTSPSDYVSIGWMP